MWLLVLQHLCHHQGNMFPYDSGSKSMCDIYSTAALAKLYENKVSSAFGSIKPNQICLKPLYFIVISSQQNLCDIQEKTTTQSIVPKHLLINFGEIMSYSLILVPVPKVFYANQRFKQKEQKRQKETIVFKNRFEMLETF